MLEELQYCIVFGHKEQPIIGFCQNPKCQIRRKVCHQCFDLHFEQINKCKKEDIKSQEDLNNILDQFKQINLEYLDNQKMTSQIQKYLMIQEFKEFIKYWEEQYKKWDYLESMVLNIRNDLNKLRIEEYIYDSIQKDINGYLQDIFQNKISEINEIIQDKQNFKVQQLINKLDLDFVNNQKEVLEKINRQLYSQINMKENQMFRFLLSQYNSEEQLILEAHEKFIHFFNIEPYYGLIDQESDINFDNLTQDKYFQIQICRKGQLIQQLNKHDESLRIFEQIIKLFPLNLNAFLSKSLLLEQLNDYEGAIKCMQQFIQIQPHNYQARNQIGLTLIKQGKLDDAIDYYEKLIQYDSTYCEAYHQKAAILQEKKNYLKSIECLDELLQIQPSNYQTIVLKIEIYNIHLQDHEKVIACSDQLIQMYPTNLYAYSQKSQIYFSLQKFQQAIECWDQLIIHDPKNVQAYDQKSKILIYCFEYTKALECCDTAIKINPQHYYSYEIQASIFQILCKYKQAIKCWDQLISLAPKYYYAYDKKAELLVTLANYEESDSQSNYQEAINLWNFLITKDQSVQLFSYYGAKIGKCQFEMSNMDQINLRKQLWAKNKKQN